MTIEINNVRRLRVREAGQSDFSTDLSTTVAAFTDVPFVEGTVEAALNEESLSPQFAQQHLDGHPEQVRGIKSATLGFQLPFLVTGTAQGNNNRPIGNGTENAMHHILSVVMGDESDVAGDLTVSGSTATAIEVGAGPPVDAGEAMGITLNGVHELREVESLSGTTITPKLAFSSAPASGTTINGVVSYSLRQNPIQSLQWILAGEETQDRWLIYGSQLESITLNDLGPGMIPKFGLRFQAANWLYGDDAATDLTAGSQSQLGDATYAGEVLVIKDSEFRVATHGTQTLSGTEFHPTNINIQLNLSYTPVRTPGGMQTILRYRRARSAPIVQGSFTLPFEDWSWFDHRDNRTDLAMFYQIGSVAGQACLISVPKLQVTNVQRTDQDGLAYQEVTWVGRLDDSGGNAQVDSNQSAFRMHFQ